MRTCPKERWIKWDPIAPSFVEQCPEAVRDTMVDVKFRNGMIHTWHRGRTWAWGDCGTDFTIVAYRISR